MEIEELIDKIADQLKSHDRSKLGPQTVLSNIEGYSSLERLFIIMMVDENYNVTLTDTDMQDSSTIEDLYNTIKSRM